jgi:hypothetical protein
VEEGKRLCRNAPGSHLGKDTGYRDLGMLPVSSDHADKCRYGILKLISATFVSPIIIIRAQGKELYVYQYVNGKPNLCEGDMNIIYSWILVYICIHTHTCTIVRARTHTHTQH